MGVDSPLPKLIQVGEQSCPRCSSEMKAHLICTNAHCMFGAIHLRPDLMEGEEPTALAGAASHNGQGWVIVEDRLPEEGKYVLAFEPRGGIFIGFNMRLSWCDVRGVTRPLEQVTHWQPLPVSPLEASLPTTAAKVAADLGVDSVHVLGADCPTCPAPPSEADLPTSCNVNSLNRQEE